MKKEELVCLTNPKSPNMEAYRTLRTNILFSGYEKKVKTIAVTSAGPGEGKSTIALNLATTFALNGSKTIVIDCDLRKASIHKKLRVTNTTGLTNVLIGECPIDAAIKKTEVENLDVLTVGIKPPNPAETLSSKRMHELIEKIKEEYEYVIIDTPPILFVTDAQIISQYVDGCLFVVASGETEKDAAKKAKDLLEKVGANIIGVVLNKTDKTHSYAYYNAYSYYGEKAKKKSSLFSFLFRKKRDVGV